jgi:hypothetical protein
MGSPGSLLDLPRYLLGNHQTLALEIARIPKVLQVLLLLRRLKGALGGRLGDLGRLLSRRGFLGNTVTQQELFELGLKIREPAHLVLAGLEVHFGA